MKNNALPFADYSRTARALLDLSVMIRRIGGITGVALMETFVQALRKELGPSFLWFTSGERVLFDTRDFD